MNESSILLTIIGNYAGYALAGLVLIWLFKRGNPSVARIGTAVWMLATFWLAILSWYVVSEFWLGTYTINTEPDWLASSNGIAENNHSEVFQIWLATLVYKWLRAPGSPESK